MKRAAADFAAADRGMKKSAGSRSFHLAHVQRQTGTKTTTRGDGLPRGTLSANSNSTVHFTGNDAYSRVQSSCKKSENRDIEKAVSGQCFSTAGVAMGWGAGTHPGCLGELGIGTLSKRAKEVGATEDQLMIALDNDSDPKAALIALILRRTGGRGVTSVTSTGVSGRVSTAAAAAAAADASCGSDDDGGGGDAAAAAAADACVSDPPPIFDPVVIKEMLRNRQQHALSLAEGPSPSATDAKAPVYMAAVMDYITGEMLEAAGNAARERKETTIDAKHIQMGIARDDELNKVKDSCQLYARWKRKQRWGEKY